MTSEPNGQNNNLSQSGDNIDFDSWDDIQLTPVKAPHDGPAETENHVSVSHNPSLKPISEKISGAFKDLDDSFMYLGVLKKLPLPEATRFFEKKFSSILQLFEKVWENTPYPEKDPVFNLIGEDYSKLNKLIHSGDAILPIYEGLKAVYENVGQLKDSGMNLPEAMETLKEIFKNRKSHIF